MTVSGMDAWTDTEAYRLYADYHDEEVYGAGKASSPIEHVVHRALHVIRNGEGSRYYDKVTGYNARALGQFEADGAGSRKFAGVAKNVCALRCWGYDPYYTYTS